MSIRILFVNSQFSTSTTNILHSQLYDKARTLSSLGIDCFYFGADYPESSLELSFLIDKYKFTKYSVVNRLPKGGVASLFVNSYSMRGEFLNFVKDNGITHVYFRNAFDFLIFSNLLVDTGIKTIYDSRSVLFAEVKEKGRLGGLFSPLIRVVEKNAVKKSSYLFCVSEAMSKWLLDNWNRPSDLVIPCTCDLEGFQADMLYRVETRKQLNWVDKKVIVYSGGTSVWQRINDILTLFQELYSQDSDFRFLIVSRDKDAILAKLDVLKLPKEAFHIVSCEHHMVSKWLSVADVSIIMRDSSLVNKVASPIKVAEYLSLGLPVICTDGIGDYSKVIVDNNAGCVLNENLSFQGKLQKINSLFNNKVLISENAKMLSNAYSKEFELSKWANFFFKDKQ